MNRPFYKYTYIILLGLILASCSDELAMPSFGGIEPDGTVELSFSVPAPQVVVTRTEADPENRVNDITVLVFNGSGNDATLAQITSTSTPILLENSGSLAYTRYSASFRLANGLKNETDLSFLFIANRPDSPAISEGMTLSEAKSLIAQSVGTSGNLTMCGESSLSKLFTQDILFTRNAAKVTVTNVVPANSSEGTTYSLGTTAYPFEVFGTAFESPLFAGLSEGKGTSVQAGSYPNNLENGEVRYLHPVANSDGKTFTIVKAQYGGNDYFYRLDFKTIDKNTSEPSEIFLDLLPNHWYQFLILEVSGAGYASPEEASRHLESPIRYEIHDHAPAIYNMITDGIRELGVTHEIVYEGNPTDDETDPALTKKLYVKFYSKNGNETESISSTNVKEYLKIPTDCSWLEIGNISEVTDNPDIAGEGFETDKDPNHKGKVFECELKFKQTDEQGSLDTEITATWMGLTRQIPVTWVREFKGTDLCSVKLIIRDADGNELQNDNKSSLPSGNYTINNYWDFIGGETVDGVMLYGIAPDKNNGKVRNQGLHFPVMYGDKGKIGEARWSYAYEIDMTALTEYDFDWNLSVEDDDAKLSVLSDYVEARIGKYLKEGEYKKIKDGFSGTHKANENLVFTITRPGNALKNAGEKADELNDYQYSTGKLIITITPKSDSQKIQLKLATKYTIDLYHTGFFHKDSQSHREPSAEQDASNYYYYEVVPIKGAFRMRYWLDRNLGAKSSGMYVEATGGTPYQGDKDAAGGYFKVARRGADYTGPEMYDELNNKDNDISRVSPPGYRVPKQKVWDALKNSDNFHTDAIGAYYSAYYDTGVPAIGNVYFPKAMIRINGNPSGESRAGYYWTQTEATGTEKEEIGAWLKMLMISGTSASYINGSLGIYESSEHYAASVRCINDIPDETELQRTYFNVSGATHVFLYTESPDGIRTPTTVWPGHAIGNYATMQTGWFNFVLESADFAPGDLYVIFNFIGSDGIIRTMSKGADGSAYVTTDKSPASLKGWKVENDDKLKTHLGYWWKCEFDNQTIQYGQKRSDIKRTIYLLNSPWSDTRIHYWGGEVGSEWDNLPKMTSEGSNKFSALIPDDTQYILFRDGSDKNNKTGDILLDPLKSTYDYTQGRWIE